MNLSNLTLAEVEIVERKSGQSITSMGDENKPKAGLFAALAWVIKKREDPSFTYEQAQALTMAESSKLIGDDEEEPVDPTRPLPLSG